MAKLIRMTPEYIEQVRKEFEEILISGKFPDGKIKFEKSFSGVKQKATVYFTEIAWLKMQTLIKEFDKEIAWHGVAYRYGDPANNEYMIKDIMVYPQEVTSATVTTDQTKYSEWLMGQDDDVFNNIRMQGHSHVNMGVTPSAVDESLYERILGQLDDSMFYIFLIYNKSGAHTYKIYDMAKNTLFETADVEVAVIDGEYGLNTFLEVSKDMVKDRVFQTPNYPSYQGGYPSYQYGKTYGLPQNAKPVVTQQQAQTKGSAPASAAKAEEKKENSDKKDSPQKSGGTKRKFKRAKGKTKQHTASAYYYDDFDDEEDYYGPYGYTDRFYRQ